MSSNLVSNTSEPVSTLRIKPHEQEKLLKLIEVEQATNDAKAKRKSERVAVPEGVGVSVSITQPGGSSGNYLVRGTNLSAEGIGFIHGGYVHIGSKAVVTLTTPEGERVGAPGLVKRCEYITNGVHSVGVAFDQPFDVESFLGGEDHEAPVAAVRVRGRVLVVDDSDPARRLAAYMLNRIGATVYEAVSLEAVPGALNGSTVDLVLSDVWLGDRFLPDFLTDLRQHVGGETPVIAITGDERSSTGETLQQAGCTEVLTKPVAPAVFNAAVAKHLSPAEPSAKANGRKLVSEMWGDTVLRPLIIRFVRDLEAILGDLDAQLGDLGDEERKTRAYNACMRLGADAAAYGFPSIQSVGNTLCMLIDGGADASELQSQLVDLQSRVEAAVRAI